MCKSDPPPAPDYTGAAIAQGEANKEAALQTAVLSNPNVYTPYGSQTVSWGQPGQSGGMPGYTSGGQVFYANQVGGQSDGSPTGTGGQGGSPQPNGTWAPNPSGGGGGSGTGNANVPFDLDQNPYNRTGRGWEDGGRMPNEGVGTGGYTSNPYQPGGSSTAGTPQANVVQTFSPSEQAKYDANTGLELGLLDTATTGLGRVDTMMGTEFDTSGMQQVGGIGDPNSINTDAYLRANPDVLRHAQANGMDPAAFARLHYQEFGMGEGREGTGIPELNTRGLTDMASIDPSQLSNVNRMNTSDAGLLDVNSYLQQNPDVLEYAKANGIDPRQFAQQHYQEFGFAENREGGPPKGNLNTKGMFDISRVDSSKLGPEGQLSNADMGPGGSFNTSQLQSGQLNSVGLGGGNLSADNMRNFAPLSNQGLRGLENVDLNQLSQFRDVNQQGLGNLQNIDRSQLSGFQSLNQQGLPGQQNVDLNQLSPNGQLNRDGVTNVNTVDSSRLRDYTTDPSVGGLNQITEAIRARGDVDFQERRRDLESDLIARGFTPESEGYQTRMRELERQQNDFNTQAILSGGQEQSRIAGLENSRRSQGLGEQQAEYASQMGLRGQKFGESQAMAGFAQQLRAQGLSEQQIQAQMQNAIRGQQFGERSSVADDAARQRQQMLSEQGMQAQFSNQNRAQEFGERSTIADDAARRRGQELGEQATRAGVTNQARGQEFGERSAISSDAMQQRGQEYGERQTQAQFDEQKRASRFGERGAEAQFTEQQRGQRFNEQGAQAQLSEQQRNRQFAEQESMAQFAQQLRAQGMTEQQVQAQVNNAARNQQFGERQGVANFAEQQRAARIGEQGAQQTADQAMRSQDLNIQQATANMQNANRGQEFSERGAVASFDQGEQQRNYQNTLSRQQAEQNERQRQMQEQAYLRQLPLNEINALRTGSQANLPQFQGYSGAQVQAAPLFDASVAGGNYNMAAYQSQPDVMGGLFQLGAAAIAPGVGGLFGMGK